MRRQQLIDRKHEVQGRIRELRPRVERARREATTRRDQARAAKLQRELEGLMAEEALLRQEIDRTS
jgi:hypothetical protein